MTAARRRHHKAENLSAQAMQVIEDGLVGGRASYDAIAAKVLELTGEKISPASIGRYHGAKVRPRQEALQGAQAMAREMSQWVGSASSAEIRMALQMRMAKDLFPLLEQYAKDDPANAGYFYAELEKRRLEELRLAQRNSELQLRTEQLDHQKKLAEARLAEIRKRLEPAAGEKAKKERTPAELEKLIRDVYGIVQKSAPASEPA